MINNALKLAAAALAVLNAAAALTLLLLSGWFIAASALAGSAGMAIYFNYVIPSTIIRFLAFARVLTGYGEKYVGHARLLDDLGQIRLKLYNWVMGPGHQENSQSRRADELERLNVQAEAVANFSLTVLHPNLVILSASAGLIITLAVLLPSQIPLFLITMLAFLAIWLLQLKRSVHLKRQTHTLQARYRHELEHYLNASSIWSYGDLSRTVQEQEQQWTDNRVKVQATQYSAEWWLAALSASALMASVVLLPAALYGLPLVLIIFLIFLALPDWGGPSVRSLNSSADTLIAHRDLREVRSGNATEEAETETADTGKITELQLQEFCWQRATETGSRINLTLEQGQLLWLKGSSGSGKSSLMEAITRLTGSAGKLLLNSHDAMDIPVSSLRRKIAYSEQFPYILSDSLRQNLLLAAPQASDETLLQTLREVGLEDLVASGLDEWLETQGRELSGGERKKIGLARVLLSGADVWLLDEPFEGLDEQSSDALQHLISARQAENIIILASHSRAAQLAADQELNLDTMTPADIS